MVSGEERVVDQRQCIENRDELDDPAREHEQRSLWVKAHTNKTQITAQYEEQVVVAHDNATKKAFYSSIVRDSYRLQQDLLTSKNDFKVILQLGIIGGFGNTAMRSTANTVTLRTNVE